MLTLVVMIAFYCFVSFKINYFPNLPVRFKSRIHTVGSLAILSLTFIILRYHVRTTMPLYARINHFKNVILLASYTEFFKMFFSVMNEQCPLKDFEETDGKGCHNCVLCQCHVCNNILPI